MADKVLELSPYLQEAQRHIWMVIGYENGEIFIANCERESYLQKGFTEDKERDAYRKKNGYSVKGTSDYPVKKGLRETELEEGEEN